MEREYPGLSSIAGGRLYEEGGEGDTGIEALRAEREVDILSCLSVSTGLGRAPWGTRVGRSDIIEGGRERERPS